MSTPVARVGMRWALGLVVGMAGCGGASSQPLTSEPGSSASSSSGLSGGNGATASSSGAAGLPGQNASSSSAAGLPGQNAGSSSSSSDTGGGGSSSAGGSGNEFDASQPVTGTDASASSSSTSGSGGSGSLADARAPAEDSGGSAAAGDGGGAASGCAGKSYKFCEDFETGTVGALPTGWTQFAGYAAASPTDVALASDEFHSGKMSLKSDSMMRGQARAQRSLASLGATAANHWGRIFYKVESPSPKPNTYLHVTFTSLVGPAGENRIVDTVEAPNGNTHQWLFNIPSDGCCTSTAYNWTFDSAWHCAEWWVDVATDSYRFFSDSMEVTSLAFTGKTNSTMSDYTAIVVGATWYQSNGAISSPFVIWFDDLAIDDTQIGCQ
jgi:hypothetical protein